MAYATLEQLQAVDSAITEEEVSRWRYRAERTMDQYTTGADNIRKLKIAFPTEEDDAEAVIRCEAEIIRLMEQIDAARQAAEAAAAYTQRPDGTYAPGALASVSSGSESMSFASASAVPKTAVTAAAQDPAAEASLYRTRVRFWLAGVQDKNGVNLLYGGVYPVCIETS